MIPTQTACRFGQRDHREDVAQPAAEHVERELRTGDVGDDEVEEALAGLQARRLGGDRRRGEVGELAEQVRADGLLGATSGRPSSR